MKKITSKYFYIFLLSLCILFTSGCQSTLNKNIVHEESHYLSLDSKINWETIESVVKSGKALPVELFGENLSVLKNIYHKENRHIDKINYVGVIFYFNRNVPLTTSTLLSLRKNDNLLKKIVNIRQNLSNQSSINEGMVLLLNSFDSLSDVQAQVLSKAPVVCLMLEDLPYMSVKQAKIISEFNGKSLCLNSILWIGKNHSKALANFNGQYLSLNKIRALSRE